MVYKIIEAFKDLLYNKNALLGILIVVGFLLYKCHNKLENFVTQTFGFTPKKQAKQNRKLRVSLTSSSRNRNMVERMENSGDKKDVTLYFATGCSHCDNFKRTWSEFEKYCSKHNKNITYKAVNCAEEDGYEKCKNANIEGVPTVLVKSSGKVKEYPGQQDVNKLITFVETL